jgi:5'-3' exonuclease
MNFILIDGSYYTFYRFYALNIWWKHANTLSENINKLPIDCPAFVDKFKETFVSKINDIDKGLKLKNTIKYVGRDCKRSDIWRTKIYPEYKGTRETNASFTGAPFFQMVSDENLFEKANVKGVLSYPSLEADDCIALTTMHLYDTYPDAHIWIIASDMDYLQLTNEHVHLYDLKFKNIAESKKTTGNSQCDLFCKIVAGDKSDNISSIFKKCGIKTAEKYFNDKELFQKKLDQDKEAQKIYERNKMLVDFNYIPVELVEGFSNMYLKNM